MPPGGTHQDQKGATSVSGSLYLAMLNIQISLLFILLGGLLAVFGLAYLVKGSFYFMCIPLITC